MKYSIGYQLPDDAFSVYELCRDYSAKVSDVYFSYAGEPSGRFSLSGNTADETAEIQALQLEELREIKKLGKTLTLLFNANCYGEQAVSRSLQAHVLERTAFLKKELDIDHITTTSPFLAKAIKKEFGSSIQVRASVNMRIGSIAAMEQLARDFDGYYLQKEYNRNFAQIKRLSEWCRDNGKQLFLLANSGCLNYCAFQTFHDNLIAHKVGETADDSVNTVFPAPCHEYLNHLGAEKGITAFLQGNFIRPEDVHYYEPYFDEMKLATRMHARPRMVLAAYCRERFTGNLLDLTEPSYSGRFKGHVLDNTQIPADWFAAASDCGKNCENCTVCADAVQAAICKMNF